MMQYSEGAADVSEWRFGRFVAIARSTRARSWLGTSAFLAWIFFAALPASVAGASFPSPPPPATTAELAQRVVLLANADDPDSLRVARHYAEVRGVPVANIIALRLPRGETLSWREFIDQLWNPLAARLIRDKWIEAIPGDNKDALGRQRYAVYGHRIAALVTCRGVPLSISHDAALYTAALPFTQRPEFRTNQGAVDAELSLLAVPTYAINAFMPNPLFQKDRPTPLDIAQVVKVARLDGPTVESALALVDHAVEAERTGLLGRAYVDIGGSYPLGDEWFDDTAKQLAALDFDTAVDRQPTTMPATARIDAPVLYFGWYAGSINGPFALPGFQFPPGAIALHLHSFSAATLRSGTGWTGPFVARGATATFGNVFEPYLDFTHRPNLLVRALARGANLVDATYYSLRALSWQQVVIGDPLYRPFAVPLDEQLKAKPSPPSRLSGYAVLRKMHELDRTQREADATALAIVAQRERPSLAVGVALARRLHEKGDANAAADALGFVSSILVLNTDEWALMGEAAQLLETYGRATRAVAVWRILFAQPKLPAELRLAWLPEARRTAEAAGDPTQAAGWQKEFDDISAIGSPKK